jgi:hypothetical protein
LALVWLKGTNDFVVRDITDINHPLTVSSLGSQVNYGARFVNAAELSDADGGVGLFRMPLSGSPQTVVSGCGAIPFDWHPDGTAAGYIKGGADPKFQDLHLVGGGTDRVVDSMPAQYFGVGCESRGCADTWTIQLLYSTNGDYIAFVQQLPVSVFRIWTSSGKLLKSLDGSTATMPVWSGNSLYWRDDKGVEMWRNGSQTLVLPGVSWIRPHASSTGGQIAYETRDPGYSTAHISVLDTATGAVREIAQSRSELAFLTSRYIWYVGERACSPAGSCFAPTEATGITYIYDLQSGIESQSIIAYVFDVWPHPA